MQIASANVVYPQRWNYLGFGTELARAAAQAAGQAISPFAQQGAYRLGHAIFGNTVGEDQVAQSTRDAQAKDQEYDIRSGAKAQQIATHLDIPLEEAQKRIDDASTADMQSRRGTQAGGISGGTGDSIASNEQGQVLKVIGADGGQTADPTVRIQGSAPSDPSSGSPTQDLTGVPSSAPSEASTSPTEALTGVAPEPTIKVVADKPAAPPPVVNPASTQSTPTLEQTAQAANVQAQASQPGPQLQVAAAMQNPNVREKAHLFLQQNQGLMAQMTQNIDGKLDPNDQGRSSMMANLTKAHFDQMLDALNINAGINTDNLKAFGYDGAAKMYLAQQAKDPNFLKTMTPDVAKKFVEAGQAYEASYQPILSKMSLAESAMATKLAGIYSGMGQSGITMAQGIADISYKNAIADRTRSLTKPEVASMEASTEHTKATTGLVTAETLGKDLSNDLMRKTFPSQVAMAQLQPEYQQLINKRTYQQLQQQEQLFPEQLKSLQTANTHAGYAVDETRLKNMLVEQQILLDKTKNYLAPKVAVQNNLMKRISDNTASRKSLMDNIEKYDIGLMTNAYTTEDSKAEAIKNKGTYVSQLRVYNAEAETLNASLGDVNQKIGEDSPEKVLKLRNAFDPNPDERNKAVTYWGARIPEQRDNPQYFPGEDIAHNLASKGAQLGQSKQPLPSFDTFKNRYGPGFVAATGHNPTTVTAKTKYAYQILQASYKDAQAISGR